jgi:crotonobetainyl-CoA:carnitine CoA-transferase CaiB-like acyl-CoA transferase
MDRGANNKPLAGIKVIDFTRVFAGPYCTMLLADLGADVVKIEIPGKGDLLRTQGPPFFHGMGITFLATNRNKRSITLDLQSEQGKKIAYDLCMNADVLVENFRPDVMPRLGLGYEQLVPKNPKLVYGAISGLGADGPDRLQGALDVTIQGIGGYMSITGEVGGRPMKLGTSAFDMVSGMNCQSAILAALLQRVSTGRGQKIETSLLEGEVAFLANAALEYLITGNNPKKWGSEHAQLAPLKVYETSDGWVVIVAGYQNMFESFAKVLGRDEWITDPRFIDLSSRVTNRDALNETVEAELIKFKTDDLIAKLEAAKVPCAPVNNMEQVFSHRQVLHRNMLTQVEHAKYGKLPQLGPAVKYSEFDVTESWTAPPLLGEHTESVLQEWLGLRSEDIAGLRASKAI